MIVPVYMAGPHLLETLVMGRELQFTLCGEKATETIRLTPMSISERRPNRHLCAECRYVYNGRIMELFPGES